MRTMKVILILLFLTSAFAIKAQWTLNSENVKMYTLNIEGNNGPDNTRFLQGLLNNYSGVLLARIKIDGTVFIFSENALNTDAIRDLLKSNTGIKAGKVTEVPFSKEEYYKAYMLFDFPATEYYSEKKPERLFYQDKQKEEKAYSIAKTLWVEFFPEAYKEFQPAPKALTEEELRIKAQKESNINFNSKSE